MKDWSIFDKTRSSIHEGLVKKKMQNSRNLCHRWLENKLRKIVGTVKVLKNPKVKEILHGVSEKEETTE